MAEDDRDSDRERGIQRETEAEAEMEHVDQDPDQVQEGDDSLGTQSAPSGAPRDREEGDVTDDEEDKAIGEQGETDRGDG